MTAVVSSLRALLAESTPGPWSADAEYFVGQVADGRPGGEVIGYCRPTVTGLPAPNRANAQLIVAMRNCLPALLDAADALERLRPILQNSRETFLDPPNYSDTSLNAYRFEGLAAGCLVGLNVIDAALVRLGGNAP